MSWNCVAVTGRTISKLTPYVQIPYLGQELKVPGRSSPIVHDPSVRPVMDAITAPSPFTQVLVHTDPNSAPSAVHDAYRVLPGRVADPNSSPRAPKRWATTPSHWCRPTPVRSSSPAASAGDVPVDGDSRWSWRILPARRL
jgi:hypothetical protein